MTLQRYIRQDQEFLIFIRSQQGAWERYDPDKHGAPSSLRGGYVVAYLNGEIIENRVNLFYLPPGTHHAEESGRRPKTMPDCKDDSRVQIWNEPSRYHPPNQKYCTRVRNTGDTQFRILRFAPFERGQRLGRYLLFTGSWRYRRATASNGWFTQDQFVNRFNQKTPWISPGEEVADQDNFEFGDGFWVFEVAFRTGETIFVKSKLPNRAELDPAIVCLCANLVSLGVKAHLAESGRPEENFTAGWGRLRVGPLSWQWASIGWSLGLIDIQDGPIRWVNVRKCGGHEGAGQVSYIAEYGIPVPGMPREFPHVHLKLIRHKTIPLLGRVKRVEWIGKDFGLGIAGRLSNDSSVADLAMTAANSGIDTDLDIDADPAHGCWMLAVRTVEPSRQLWECYQLIARHLLETPIPTDQAHSP